MIPSETILMIEAEQNARAAAYQQRIAALEAALRGAWHALKSYEYGNSAPDLAKEAAEAIERVIPRL